MTLDEKIADVLGRLQMLSEASGTSFEPRTSHGSTDGRVPPGVNVKEKVRPTDPAQPPKKDDSLYEFWRWRFARAYAEGESEFEMHRLFLIAERDYGSIKYHSPDRMALRSGDQHRLDNDAIDGGAAERAAGKRVVDLYEGVPAAEVAVHEYATEEWVKKARRQLGRQPHDGRPRPEFLDLDDDARRRRVAVLASRMGKKAAAGKLGVDPQTVRRYWPEPDPIAA